MKLGVAFNVFNGEELLIDSMNRMRMVADYIVLTYQNTSNVGNRKVHKFDDVAHLCDDIVLFEPNDVRPAINETNKRNLGLYYARKNGCSHFMSIDCDEFYHHDQFVNAKNLIIEKGFESTACELVNYFHSSKYQIVAHRQFVPFIFRITEHKHKHLHPFPVVVDPTRVISQAKFHLFDKSELLMHHMSYVRKDLDSMKSKLMNSPNRKLFADIIPYYLNYFKDWDSTQSALNPHQFKKGLGGNYVQEVEHPIELSVCFNIQ